MSKHARAEAKKVMAEPAADPITLQIVRGVSPSLARDWLGKNWDRNRLIRDSRVTDWEREMVAGRWRVTHQGIAFNKDGTLIDGQHRLTALAGCPDETRVDLLVFYYTVPCDGLGVIDIGAPRSAGDGFSTEGLTSRVDGGIAASTAGMLWQGLHRTEKHAARAQTEETYRQYKEEIDWAIHAMPKNHFASPVRAAFAFAWPCDRARVEAMAHTVRTRIGLQEASAELALVNVTDGKNSKGSIGRVNLFYMTLAALKHGIKGTKIGRVLTPSPVTGAGAMEVPIGLTFFLAQRRLLGLGGGEP